MCTIPSLHQYMTVRDDIMHTSHPYIFPQTLVRLSEDIAGPNPSRKIIFVPRFPHVYIHVHVCTNACAHVHTCMGWGQRTTLAVFFRCCPPLNIYFNFKWNFISCMCHGALLWWSGDISQEFLLSFLHAAPGTKLWSSGRVASTFNWLSHLLVTLPFLLRQSLTGPSLTP